MLFEDGFGIKEEKGKSILLNPAKSEEEFIENSIPVNTIGRMFGIVKGFRNNKYHILQKDGEQYLEILTLTKQEMINIIPEKLVFEKSVNWHILKIDFNGNLFYIHKTHKNDFIRILSMYKIKNNCLEDFNMALKNTGLKKQFYEVFSTKEAKGYIKGNYTLTSFLGYGLKFMNKFESSDFVKVENELEIIGNKSYLASRKNFINKCFKLLKEEGK